MKKLSYLLLGASVLSLVVVLPKVKTNLKGQSILKYQELLADFHHQTPSDIEGPTGPDKAAYRDFQMTVDIDKGYVPVKNLQMARELISTSRIAEGRDFQWSNLPINIPGRARAIMVDPNDDGLWSGTVTGGLWKNADYGANQTWQLKEDMEAISVSCMAYDPQENQTMYLGTGESHTAFVNYRESTGLGSGIWKSVDAGVTWNQLESSMDFAFINDLVIRVEDGISVIYAATASGEYWSEFFDTTPSDGLYRSDDGGATWQQVLPNIEGESVSYAVSDIEIANDGTLYVGTMRNLAFDGGGKILKSTDGVNWEVYDPYVTDLDDIKLSAPLGWKAGRVIIKSAPSNPDRIYALFMAGFENSFSQFRDHSFSLRLYQSPDGGVTWSGIALPGGWSNIPWHAAAIAVDPNTDSKLVIGALDVYVLHDADNPDITELDWLQLTSWFAHPGFSGAEGLSQDQLDSMLNHYVHADIHDMRFVGGNSDQFLITTDGGVFFSANMTDSDVYDSELNPDSYPHFKSIDNAQRTGQYYTIALDPTVGSSQILAGAQDNGTVLAGNELADLYNNISGGDGAFAAWDGDDDLKITMSQSNYMVFHHGDARTFVGDFRSGQFINPFDYDDVNNLMYCNMSVGRQGGLIESLSGAFLDSLLVYNTSPLVGKGLNGFPQSKFIKLGTETTEPFSAVKLSPLNDQTVYVGTHFGKVYRSDQIHGIPEGTRIDNDQLPVGYVSSIDIGNSEDVIMVTMSNYGLESVWYTSDGGANWRSLERNLPDMPVRWGLINPFDNNKVLIATELGIWGLEDVHDSAEEWKEYNSGLPRIRVDMMDLRKQDSVLAIATHGRGIWLGKLNQGEAILDIPEVTEIQSVTYPNPATTHIRFTQQLNEKQPVSFINMNGQVVYQNLVTDGRISVATLEPGMYLLTGQLIDQNRFKSKIVIQH